MKIVGIIPARFASSRFPGKPLADIAGKSMIQRVYEQAMQCNGLTQVVVATDDDRIYQHVEAFGGHVIMTSPDHQSGTDRSCEAYLSLGTPYEYIINIQGDEPFIDPLQIDTLIDCLNGETQLATLVKRIEDPQHLSSPNTVKVVMNSNQEAMYFSRSPIPYLRGVPEEEWHAKGVYYKHIGIYAYKEDILQKISRLPMSSLERLESLEQLRWLEQGYKIKTGITETDSAGIDTPEDLQEALHVRNLQRQ